MFTFLKIFKAWVKVEKIWNPEKFAGGPWGPQGPRWVQGKALVGGKGGKAPRRSWKIAIYIPLGSHFWSAFVMVKSFKGVDCQILIPIAVSSILSTVKNNFHYTFYALVTYYFSIITQSKWVVWCYLCKFFAKLRGFSGSISTTK